MDPITGIGVFLLGASAASLVTMIRFHSEMADIRARLNRIPNVGTSDGQKAA